GGDRVVQLRGPQHLGRPPGAGELGLVLLQPRPAFASTHIAGADPRHAADQAAADLHHHAGAMLPPRRAGGDAPSLFQAGRGPGGRQGSDRRRHERHAALHDPVAVRRRAEGPRASQLLPVHGAELRVRRDVRNLWRHGVQELPAQRLAGSGRLRDGPPAGAPQRRNRPRAVERLRVGLRHRTHGHAQARRGRHPPVLRVRPAFPGAVLVGPPHPALRATFPALRGSVLTMRISYEWLSDFVDLDGVTPKEAADVLTRLGVEVESLTLIDLSQILIGRVLEQIPHPKSRNPLWVHQVDLGDGRTQQIIAGAPNAVVGSLVPVALPGTTVPNGKLVKDMNIAGYQASGMLCSASELLLGDDHSGILILDSGTPGAPLTSVIPNQAVMEAEITSNRPDCMGHLGVARELAAG